MLMRNIALPTGPYDWHPERLSRDVYVVRLLAFRAVLQVRGLGGAIVTGSTFDDGALVWLTGFTPKLGPAFVIVPAVGEPRLLFSGGPGMRPSAQKLTWLDDVVALRDFARDVRPKFVRQNEQWGLCEDAGLSLARWRAVLTALGSQPIDVTSDVSRLRSVPEAQAASLIRHAVHVVGQTEAVLSDAANVGETRWAARLAAEKVAFAAGAQDLRLKMSRRDDGPVEPVDPDGSILPKRAAVTLAVRVDGYWLCGRTLVGENVPSAPGPWRQVMSQLSEGVAISSVMNTVLPMQLEIFPIGHSLVETSLDREAKLSPGQFVCVLMSSTDPERADLSALIEVGRDRLHLLWAAAPILTSLRF